LLCCGLDLNQHTLSGTSPSSWRVYQIPPPQREWRTIAIHPRSVKNRRRRGLAHRLMRLVRFSQQGVRMYGQLSRAVSFLALAVLSIVLSSCPSPHQSSTTYTLTVTSGPYGTATPAGAHTVESGAATSISASPDAGFVFVNWTVTRGTASISGANSSTPIVTLTSGNATVQASFTNPPGTHILTIAATTGCHTMPSGAMVYHPGSPVSISATADAGYIIPAGAVWTAIGGVTFVNASLSATTVTLSSDATIAAHVTL
jgi:hypothetical protein